ncbi:MAG: hypothetical protein ACI9JL_004194 [Paracoccaceae bacterium]|jgi:hypothetical protein
MLSLRDNLQRTQAIHRLQSLSEEMHDALTGHMTASIGRRYGSGFPLAVLARHVNLLSYPGFDLGHLYQEESDSV